MTVNELIDRLAHAPLDAEVYVATPVPTEMNDCKVTGASLDPDDR